MSYNNLQVIYINDEGEITAFVTEVVERDGVQYLQFKTNHFSVYAIVGDAPEALPKTGESNNMQKLLYLAAGMFIVINVKQSYKKKKCEQEN